MHTRLWLDMEEAGIRIHRFLTHIKPALPMATASARRSSISPLLKRDAARGKQIRIAIAKAKEWAERRWGKS